MKRLWILGAGIVTAAQDQRIKSSQTQAFWFGYGKGDCMEASELANVRGERGKPFVLQWIDLSAIEPRPNSFPF